MAIVTDSLGRRWNSALHPRDRKGRFIHTFRLVKLFDAVGSSSPWGVGKVTKINDEGHIDITVTKTRDGHKVQAGQKVTMSADKLESVNERADLRKARSDAGGPSDPNSPNYTPNANVTEQNKGLAKQNARQKEKPGAGPRAFGMATGFTRADGIAAEQVLENPDATTDNKKARLLAGLWLDHERNAGQISDQDFIESLDDLGVDPNVTDGSPDGRTGLQSLVDDYNSENPARKAVVPQAAWVEWENAANGNRIGYGGDIVQGKSGKSFVKSEPFDIVQNEDGTWGKQEKKRAAKATLSDDGKPDFPSPEEISEKLEGKFDGEPSKVNANVGGKKFHFEKTEDEGIYDVTVTDDTGNEVYSGDHDASDTPNLAADLYESATGEEYTDDIGGSDGDILANIPDVDDEGNPLIPEQAPEENAKPEGGAPEDDDEKIADLASEAQKSAYDTTGLSDDERAALRVYQHPVERGERFDSVHWRTLNAKLREGRPLDEEEQQVLDLLKGVAERNPTTEDTTVFRGIRNGDVVFGGEWSKQDLTGTRFRDNGVLSTTSQAETAEGFAGKHPTDSVVMKVNVPAGTPHLNLNELLKDEEGFNPRESEIIFMPSHEMEITFDSPGKTQREMQIALLKSNGDDTSTPSSGPDISGEQSEQGDDDTDIPELERDEDLEEDFRRTQDGPDPEPREGRSTDATEPADPATEPETDGAERDVWDVIDSAELNGDPVDYKDGWKIQREEWGEDGTEEQLHFVDPDGYKHPFDELEADADEDGPTSTKADVDKAFEDARDRYNANRDQAPAPTEEPSDDQNQITEALEKSVIDGDPVPLRDDWSLLVESMGEDEDEEGASFIAPDGSRYPFDHTEVYEDPDSGKSLDRRPDADMERDFRRTQEAHADNERRRAERETPAPEPEAEAAPDEASPEQIARLEGMNNIQLEREKNLLERSRGSDDPEVQAAKAIIKARQDEYDAKYGTPEPEPSPEDEPSDGTPLEDALEKASREVREKQEAQDRAQQDDDPNHGLTQEQGDRIRKKNNIDLGRMTKDRAPGMEAAGRVAADELERRRQEDERRQKEAREAPAEESPVEEEESAEDLTEEPLDGRMSNEELDAKISEGFAGHKIEPTDELRRLFREAEEAQIRVGKIRTVKDERAWMDRWRTENLDGDTRAQARAQARDALEAERREAHEDYRAKADARSKAFIDEIRKQNDIPDPNAPEEEVTEDGDTDTGTDSSVPSTDGVPGDTESSGEEDAPQEGDGAGDPRSNRVRIDLAGKEIEADPDKALKSAWDGERARSMEREGFSNPDLHELDPADAPAFREAILASKAQNAYGAAVHVYDDEEYAQMRLFVTADGKTGIALRGDEMLAGFSSKDAADKRAMPSLHAKMIELGARRASSHDTHQAKIHAASGFVAVARVKWDDANAPEGWDKGVFSKWNNGEPDTVYYAYDPDKIDQPYREGSGVPVETHEDAQKRVKQYLAGDKDLKPTIRVDSGERPTNINSSVESRRNKLYTAASGEIVEDKPFTPSVEGGYKSTLRKVTFADGTVGIVKPVDDGNVIDNNMAYEQVVNALGGKSQVSIPFYYNNEQHLLSDYVEGHHLKELDTFDDETPEALERQSRPSAVAMAVADYLSMQNDRHAGNFLENDEGEIIAIDNDESEFGWQQGAWSAFENATFDMDPDAVDMALEEVKPWFQKENLMPKWEFAKERAHDFREIHSRKNGNAADETLIHPDLVIDVDDLTDNELSEAASRNPVQFGHDLKERLRKRESEDTDLPEESPEAPDNTPEVLSDPEPSAVRQLTGGWSEETTRDTTALIDPEGNRHIINGPGVFARQNGDKRRRFIINDYNRQHGLPEIPEDQPLHAIGTPVAIPEDQLPETLPGIDVPYVAYAEPEAFNPVQVNLGNGWVRETGQGLDHLIAPNGDRWDLNQEYLEGDSPEKLIKRVRRGFYLELLKDDDEDYFTPPKPRDKPDNDGGIVKRMATAIFGNSSNDRSYERNEAKALPGEKFPPNEEQQEIHDAILAEKNLIVNAKAGTGKTTTLEAAARRIKEKFPEKKILYNVFNKSVQKEAAGRMPGNVQVRTQHSIGVRWSPKWMRDRLETGMRSHGEIAMHFKMDDIGEDTKVSVARKAQAAVDEYAYSADDNIEEKHFKDSIGDYSDNEKQKIIGYANALWKDYNTQGGVTRVPFDAFRKRWALARPNLTEEGWGVEPIDILFVDEAQDTPPVLAKVYRDQIDHGIQLVAVGDPDQAIYGFTGAINFLDDLGPVMDTHLPLSKSYRYGPVIADIANRYLQLKQSLGRVVGGGGESTIERGMTDPKAILTRTNAGMIAHIIEQMEMGKKVAVPPGTKKDLLWLIDSAKGLRTGFPMRKPHDDFAGYSTWEEFRKDAEEGDNPVAVKNYRLFMNGDFDTLRGYVNNLIEPGDKGTGNDDGVMSKIQIKKNETGTVFGFEYNSGFDAWDYKDDLRELGFEYKITGEVYKKDYTNPKTKKKFKAGDPKPGKGWVHTGTDAEQAAALAELQGRIETKAGLVPDVTVSTAHKAKGLEWESVKIGDDFKGPKVDEDGNYVFPSEEELNLAYVAVTRAEKRLDPGSLDYVFGFTDDNGGIPGERKYDPDDLEARVERAEEKLDDQKRSDEHQKENTDGQGTSYANERPEDDDAANNGDPEPGDYVTVPGMHPDLNSEVPVRDPEPDLIGNDDGDRIGLERGFSYRFNDKDTEDKIGVDVFDPDGKKIGELLISEDLTSDQMLTDLNAFTRGDADDAPDLDPGPGPEATPEPDPDVRYAEEKALLQAYYSIGADMDERDLFDGYRLAHRDSGFNGWKIIDPNGEEHTIRLLDDNNRKIPFQAAALDVIAELRNREVNEPAEVPEQDLTFDERYPDPTGDEDPAELERKHAELMTMVTSMPPTDPDYIKTLTKALAYADAASGPKRAMAVPGDGPERIEVGPPQTDSNGNRLVDPDRPWDAYAGVYDTGLIEAQLPIDPETSDLNAGAIGDGVMLGLSDPNYFGRAVRVPGGKIEVSIFRDNGNKPAIPVDRFTVSPIETPPGDLVRMALDSVTRHKNKRRKSPPDVADAEMGERIWNAAKTGDREGLTEEELEWLVQLEYTMKNDDNLNFKVLENAIANGMNPTLTNFLKYMQDGQGAYRFWAKGSERGEKMRIGQHSWQWFEDTEKGRAFRRGEGPPDVRHGRIVALPTHSQPNATIWAHDENDQPMWTTDKKTGEPIPKLYRYHLNRNNKYYGLDQDGFALARPTGGGGSLPPTTEVTPAAVPKTRPTPPPTTAGSMADPTGPALDGTPEVAGTAGFDNYGKRLFYLSDVTGGVEGQSTEEQWGKIRDLTDGFADMRHGDTFIMSEGRTVYYDEDTDQMFMYTKGRYHGAQEGFDVRDEDSNMVEALDRPLIGGTFAREAQEEFEPVPSGHYRLHARTSGPAGEYRANLIEHYYHMNGHEVVIETQTDGTIISAQGKTNTPTGVTFTEAQAVNLADNAKVALERMGQTIGNTKMQFNVPTHEKEFIPDPVDGSMALAYVVQARPEWIYVNPQMLDPNKEPGTANFMPSAEEFNGLPYTLLHEFGHVHDALNHNVYIDDNNPLTRGKTNQSDIDFYVTIRDQHSSYGATTPWEGYAEAWAEWILGGPGSNEVSDAYADHYGWDASLMGPVV